MKMTESTMTPDLDDDATYLRETAKNIRNSNAFQVAEVAQHSERLENIAIGMERQRASAAEDWRLDRKGQWFLSPESAVSPARDRPTMVAIGRLYERIAAGLTVEETVEQAVSIGMENHRATSTTSAQQSEDAVAWANGDELDNMLDDRTAVVEGTRSGWRSTPLYRAHPPRSSRAADAAQAVEALKIAEAALADIGDSDRELGDNLAWCERRAAQALPAVRAALATPPVQAALERDAWISVDDRLPNRKDWSRVVAISSQDKDAGEICLHSADYVAKRSEYFTHWMPLPAAPSTAGDSHE